MLSKLYFFGEKIEPSTSDTNHNDQSFRPSNLSSHSSANRVQVLEDRIIRSANASSGKAHICYD